MILSRNAKVYTLTLISIVVVITSVYLHLHQQVISLLLGNNEILTEIREKPMFTSLTSLFTKVGIMAQQTPQLNQIGPGFWNVRASFKLFKIVDIGTHMSVIQLRNGNFLVIDTVEMNDQLKTELDQLTNNGTKIEAVVGVHPFHTLAFPGFYKLYPDAKYYGTPRHLRKLKDIKWTGELDNCKESLSKWEPEVELRIPAGEFSIITFLSSNVLFKYNAQELNTSILNRKRAIILSAYSSIISILKLYTSMIHSCMRKIQEFYSVCLV